MNEKVFISIEPMKGLMRSFLIQVQTDLAKQIIKIYQNILCYQKIIFDIGKSNTTLKLIIIKILYKTIQNFNSILKKQKENIKYTKDILNLMY